MPAPKGFNLVILGSGSTAFAAALRAQELGKTSVMTEERVLGGTCVNRGCLPSREPDASARLGALADALGIEFGALVGQKDEVAQIAREPSCRRRRDVR